MSSTTARNTVKSRTTWLMEVPARIIPTACAHSVMLILAMFCFFEKTIHEEYISIKFDKGPCRARGTRAQNYSHNHRSALTVLYMSTCLQKITLNKLMEYIA